ncbi:MAG: ATP-binding protein [Sulfurimonas sp.]|nr:ATP-binding protein [Sulfurimonas sp.]
MLFAYGRVVTGKYFYDRTKMRSDIKKLIDGGQSFMLKAPRRYGKTSLIKQLLQNDNKTYFYTDFRKVPRLELFNKQLLEYAYSLMGIEGAIKQLLENAFTFLNSHRATVSVAVGIFEASVELFASNKSEEDKFVAILKLLDQISKDKNETIYIVFDEFQDVIKMSKDADIMELLRGEIQHHENICYMFAGSNMTMMTKVFENKKAPFYNFCRKKTLEPFDKEELGKEVVKAFKEKKIVFENDLIIKDLIERCGGHPANTMLVLQSIENHMEDEDIKMITKEIIDSCYKDARFEMNDLVVEYLKEIGNKEHLHDVIFRDANKQEHVLSASSLQQKRKALVDMGHLQKIDRGEYVIIDNFLRDELIEENKI